MKPLLVINIGNSSIHIGVFDNATLVANWRAHTERDKTADEYGILFREFFDQQGLAPVQWRGAALASVVPPLTPTLVQLCREQLRVDPLVVSPQLNLGLPICYEDPRAVGADRLVTAVAAKAKYGAPLLVVDFGTATTLNAINRAGEFAGGAIAPGVDLAAEALHSATAQLPRIDLAVPPRAIATNTIEAMQAGILFGYVEMIKGMIARLRNELGEPSARVIATGGRARLIAQHTQVISTVDEQLILEGLRIIFERNSR